MSRPSPAKPTKPQRAPAKRTSPAKPVATTNSAVANVGFGEETFAFLQDLEENNERPWFEANRSRYERLVREPAFALIAAMAPVLRTFAPHFVADLRPVGGSLMRVHRDTRFAADKRPYKTHVGIQFRHATGKDIHAPGLYLHVEPSKCFIGIGLWHPEPEPLAKIRNRIVEHPDVWRCASTGAAFRKLWTLDGASLVRVPRGFDAEHPCAEDLRRKDHLAVSTLEPSLLAGAAVAKELGRRFVAAKSYLEFLCTALDLAL